MSDRQASPLVSVILPAYNAARFVETALESIHRQRYAPLEIIVVDDGSTDGTAAVAARHADVTVLRQANGGPASARNRGLQAANGEFIAFLDADDFWAPAMLPRLARQLQLQPEVEIVQGLIQQMHTHDGERKPVGAPYAFVSLSSALYRRQVFAKVGVFDASLPDNEDTDWMMRAWEKQINKLVIAELFLYYCVRSDSLTAGGTRNKAGLAHLFKRHRDRVRNDRACNDRVRDGRADQTDAARVDGARLHEFLGVAPPHHLHETFP